MLDEGARRRGEVVGREAADRQLQLPEDALAVLLLVQRRLIRYSSEDVEWGKSRGVYNIKVSGFDGVGAGCPIRD